MNAEAQVLKRHGFRNIAAVSKCYLMRERTGNNEVHLADYDL